MSKVRTARVPRRGARVLRTTLAVALVVLLGALAGYGFARYNDRQHVATATIMLHPLEGNAYSPGGRGDDLVNLETEAQVLRSDAVARAVLQRLDSPATPAALLSSVSVSVPPNTQLLEITVRARDDETAVTRASAFAEVYLEFRRARTESSVFGRTSRIEELVEVREEERKAALARLSKLSPTAPQRRLVEQQLQEIVVQIGSLRAQLATAQAIGLDPGQVVTPGQVSPAGATADSVVMTATGGIGGLALCVLVGVVRRTRAAALTVRDLDDLAGTGVPALGVVDDPDAPAEDLVASARSAVLAAPERPLVVTVAPLTAGVSALFEPLVESFTRARYEVVAVDLARAADRAALAEMVLQDAVASDVLVPVAGFRHGLQPLHPDRDHPGFDDLTASAQMRTCLEELAKRADLVVVHAPALSTPAGRSLLRASRAVLTEVTPGSSTRSELLDLQAEVERQGAELAGVVEVRRSAAAASPGTGTEAAAEVEADVDVDADASAGTEAGEERP
ncbi:hypothetical protein [Nocardioides sp. J54]|uniref:hypothetical protein n=1 Tax=Nocardioides sp. J54 TaxID=935866 RepID=UPI0012FB0AEB|nr:hypothetical protein [Nocardioides sp. J54]